jgi:beta-glucuronidase
MRPFVPRTVALILALLGVLALAAPAVAAPARPVELAQGWEFATAPAGPWKRVQVPHVFDARPLEELFQGRTAWYRLRFEGPRTQAGHGWALRFDGVRRRSEVFLNGRRLGANADPYTPFTLPAGGLRAGRQNLLTVRVDNRRTRGYREGWWNWGGISRPVRLVPRGKVSLRGVAVLGQVDCSGTCRARATVDGWLTSRAAGPVRPLVAVRLAPPGGGPVTEKTVRMRMVRPGETARVRFTVPVAGAPKLWAPEKPQLYATTVQARLGSAVEDAQQDRTGLRTVRVRDGHLELNGRRVELRGASIQEDVPGRGPAMTDEDIEGIVADLKAVNASVTRAHYLLDERLLDRLDEEGIMVWSQAPVYHRDVQLRTAAGRARELGTLRRTILEARRHPAVITHSVANELSPKPDATATTKQFLDQAARMSRDLDPTLPTSVDILAWPGYPRQQAYAQFDLLGVNSYFGWYRRAGELAELEPYLKDLHRLYPRQALVMTEFGAEATMDGPVDVKETFAFQADYLKHYLEMLERLPFMGGGIYWTLREFAVKPRWDGGAERKQVQRDGIHNKGLIDYETGARKPAWKIAAREFARTPLYSSSQPRAVAASLADPPAAGPTTLGVTVAGIALLALLAIAGGLLAWLGRDVWRAGARPPGPEPEPADELAPQRTRRRVRAAA